MDQHEIDILVKAFNGLLDDEPNSSEKLDALEQKLSGLLGQNQQEPVPVVQNPFVQSNQEDPFASTQAPVQVKATEKRPVLSDEAATEMPTDEVKEDLTQKIAELRTELDFLKAETKEHKTQISQLQKEKEKFKEQATSMTEMTEMSMKFMLQETEEAR